MPKIRIEDLTKGWGDSSVVKLFVAQKAIMGSRVWILGAHANARWLGYPEDRDRKPNSKMSGETSHISKIQAQLRDPASKNRWRAIKEDWTSGSGTRTHTYTQSHTDAHTHGHMDPHVHTCPHTQEYTHSDTCLCSRTCTGTHGHTLMHTCAHPQSPQTLLLPRTAMRKYY